jgi:tripartite-type tricarboxylate transporter receptor subunit TctC
MASTLVALPVLQADKLAFNVNDFVPIGFLGELPMTIAASPKLPLDSLSDLIALSKRQPGGLSIGTTSRGDLPHLSLELLRNRSGAALTAVHYPMGLAQGINDVITGRLAAAIEGLGGPSSRGSLKIVAVASRARLPSRPDIPTVAETIPGFVATGWFVLVAPPGTPTAITRKLNDDLHKVLALTDTQHALDQLGVQRRTMTPNELSSFVQDEQQLWKSVLTQVGLAQR